MASVTKVLTYDGLLYYTLLLRTKLAANVTDLTALIPTTITITKSASNATFALTLPGGTSGTATTLPAVDSTNAGLMTPTMLAKLNASSPIILDGSSTGYNEMTTGNIYTKDGNLYIPVSSPSGSTYSLIEISKDGIRSKTNSGTSEIYAGLTTATTSANGLMSSTDKTKLDGIATGAQVNVIETVKVNGTALSVSSKAVNIPLVTTSADGAMSHEDKTKLNGIATGAQVNVIEGVKLEGASSNLAPSSKVVTIPNASASTNGLLTSSDFTKLSGVATGALVNVIEHIKLGSQNTDLEITSKRVTIPVDTTATNNSTNPISSGAMYTALGLKAPLASPDLTGTPTAPTATAGTNTTQIATTAFVQSAISAAVTGSFKFVPTLPATGEEGYIYLVPHTHSGSSTNTNPDVKDEYIWNTSANPAQWELIGNTDLDLSNYWNKTDLVALTTSEITTIWNTGMSDE